MSTKTACPITASQFSSNAGALTLDIGGQKALASPREFSTGSFGWFANGKTTVLVNGQPLTVQMNVTLTVVGSKDAER